MSQASAAAPEQKHYARVAFEVKEIKEVTDDSGTYGWFEGYASTFAVDSGYDKVMPGAYADTIASGRKVKMLWQHSDKDVIGSFPTLMEDGKGLWVKGRINLGVQKGREAYALLKAGDLDSLSIGYSVVDRSFQGGVRLLNKLTLYEISVVTEPMNAQATITAVKSALQLHSLADVEMELQSKGYSRKGARKLISAVKQIVGLRNSADDGTAGNEAQRDAAQEMPEQASGSPQCDAAETPLVDMSATLIAIKQATQAIKGQ